MKKLFGALVLAVVLLSACMFKPESKGDMAVDFDGDTDMITFDIENYTTNTKTYVVWLNHDTETGQQSIIRDEFASVTHNFSAGWLQISIFYSSQVGVWSYSHEPSTAPYMIAFSMNNSSTSNNPIVYVNGLAVSVSEEQTPIGTGETTSTTLILSNNSSGFPFNGKIYDAKVYNRILTPAEILDLYNSRCKVINDNGLVFHATLDGAAGLSKFDGATLGASNTLVDRINGAIGVPTGNPVGYADDQLTCGG